VPPSRAHTSLHPFPTRRSSDLSSRTTDELAALLRNRRRLDGKVVAVPDERKFAARLARWGIMPRPLEELLWLTGLVAGAGQSLRSEEHTSELQSPCNLVCRLLL